MEKVKNKFQAQLNDGLKGISVLMREVSGIMGKLDVPRPIISKYLVAIEEMLLNTLQHGQGIENKSTINIVGSYDKEWAELSIIDNANPFNPLKDAPDPQINLSIEDRKIGGLGVHLVIEMMDETEYSLSKDGWNHFTMRCQCNKEKEISQ